VVVAAIAVVIDRLNANKSRQTELFMQLYDKYNDENFHRNHFYMLSLKWDDFDDYWEKYGPDNNPETNAIIASLSGFYEGLGVLAKRGLIDLTLVDDLMSGNIIQFWEKMGPIVREIRSTLNWPQAFEWTEYLYQEIRKLNS